MAHFIWILIPVWLATAGWFFGAFARLRGDGKSRRIAAWSWLLGSLMMWVHIVGSYGVAYHWSHLAALEATAQEAQRVTGVSASWGVYVNLIFAIIWTGYSAWLVRSCQAQPTTEPTHWLTLWVNRGVLWFTAGMVFMATVVFETGAVRLLCAIAFAALLTLAIWERGRIRS